MPRAPHGCNAPACDADIPPGAGEYCAVHRPARRPEARPTASERGYDAKWRRNSARFLKANPTCIDCGAPAQQADHDPHTRAELIARGEPHPDAWHWLKPRCTPCHSRKTATHDGGFGNPRK